jgi:hypothetical protein
MQVKNKAFFLFYTFLAARRWDNAEVKYDQGADPETNAFLLLASYARDGA